MSENVDFTSRCSCGPKEHSNAILMWVIALSSDSIWQNYKTKHWGSKEHGNAILTRMIVLSSDSVWQNYETKHRNLCHASVANYISHTSKLAGFE